MDDLTLLLIIFGIALGAGFFGPFTAASTLIILPSLITFTDLDIYQCLAVNMLASFCSWVFISKHMIGKKHVLWNHVPAFCILGMTGAYIGANFVFEVPTDKLQTLFGSMMFIAVGFVIFGRNVGVVNVVKSRLSIGIGYFLYCMTALWAGFFAGGSGIIFRTINMRLLGFTIVESAATGGIGWLVTSAITCLVFYMKGYYTSSTLLYAGVVALASSIGGHYGAKAMTYLNIALVKNIFVCFVILFALAFFFR